MHLPCCDLRSCTTLVMARMAKKVKSYIRSNRENHLFSVHSVQILSAHQFFLSIFPIFPSFSRPKSLFSLNFTYFFTISPKIYSNYLLF